MEEGPGPGRWQVCWSLHPRFSIQRAMGGSGWVVCAGDRGCLTATSTADRRIGESVGEQEQGEAGEQGERARRRRGREGEGRGQRGAACSMWRRAGLAWSLVIFQVTSWALLEGNEQRPRPETGTQAKRRQAGAGQGSDRVLVAGCSPRQYSVVWEPAPGACRWAC
jgi:hypothetical protein